jgi:hypothetical protein
MFPVTPCAEGDGLGDGDGLGVGDGDGLGGWVTSTVTAQLLFSPAALLTAKA